MKREFYGLTKEGKRVFLGCRWVTEIEVQRFLDKLALIYGGDEPPVFSVGSAVFDARAFAGIQVD